MVEAAGDGEVKKGHHEAPKGTDRGNTMPARDVQPCQPVGSVLGAYTTEPSRQQPLWQGVSQEKKAEILRQFLGRNVVTGQTLRQLPAWTKEGELHPQAAHLERHQKLQLQQRTQTELKRRWLLLQRELRGLREEIDRIPGRKMRWNLYCDHVEVGARKCRFLRSFARAEPFPCLLVCGQTCLCGTWPFTVAALFEKKQRKHKCTYSAKEVERRGDPYLGRVCTRVSCFLSHLGSPSPPGWLVSPRTANAP